VGALERSARALEMIEHGRAIQASARSGGREIEAQTAIKRGYLNVLHARESISHQARWRGNLSATERDEPVSCGETPDPGQLTRYLVV